MGLRSNGLFFSFEMFFRRRGYVREKNNQFSFVFDMYVNFCTICYFELFFRLLLNDRFAGCSEPCNKFPFFRPITM